MKILVLSNLFPPHGIGGYEERCRDAVVVLRERGHEVLVLTSDHLVEDQPSMESKSIEEGVLRKLWLSWFGLKPENLAQFAENVAKDMTILEETLQDWKPDLVHVWSMGGVSKTLMAVLDACGLPVLYDISDYSLLRELKHDLWFKYWSQSDIHATESTEIQQHDILVRYQGGVPAKPPQVWVRNATFTSQAVETKYLSSGYLPCAKQVIPCGIPLANFPTSPLKERNFPPQRLLFVGNIRYDKGAHTVLEALGLLVGEFPKLHLSFAGECFSWRYREKLDKLMERFSLEDHVTFLPSVERGQMSSVYAAHDLVVFPSIWEEPFSLVVLEAMASGIPLVGTLSGGSKEILLDGENALVFTADHAPSCAQVIRRLMQDPALYRQLCEVGPPLIKEHYSGQLMVDRMESFMLQIIAEESEEAVP